MLLGTYVDRRGLDWNGNKSAWMHAVAGGGNLKRRQRCSEFVDQRSAIWPRPAGGRRSIDAYRRDVRVRRTIDVCRASVRRPGRHPVRQLAECWRLHHACGQQFLRRPARSIPLRELHRHCAHIDRHGLGRIDRRDGGDRFPSRRRRAHRYALRPALLSTSGAQPDDPRRHGGQLRQFRRADRARQGAGGGASSWHQDVRQRGHRF